MLVESEQRHRIVVDGMSAGRRLDAVIAAGVVELSRAQVQRLIESRRITISGMAVDKSHRVRSGDVIDVVVPPPELLELVPEPIPLTVLYEDADLIVIDKPAGMVVHPAAGHSHGTLVNALLYHCKDLSGIGGVLRPGIVHRLDMDTSGVMVATKSERAHAGLAAAFAAKSRGEPGGIDRNYLGIVSPPPRDMAGSMRTLHGRHPVHRKKFSSKVASGKSAVTHWDVVESLVDAALIRFRLETGRTHQIRVHTSDAGFPLIGDQVYGHRPRSEVIARTATTLGRQALHAAKLTFIHPVTGQRVSFEAPLPPDMQDALKALRW